MEDTRLVPAGIQQRVLVDIRHVSGDFGLSGAW